MFLVLKQKFKSIIFIYLLRFQELKSKFFKSLKTKNLIKKINQSNKNLRTKNLNEIKLRNFNRSNKILRTKNKILKKIKY